MSAATSGAGPWTVRLAPLRHWVIAWILAQFVYAVLGTIYLRGSAWWDVLGWIPALSTVPMLAGILAHHRVPACERCPAYIPTNGSEEADRHHGWLWFSHSFGMIIGTYLVITVLATVPGLIFGSNTATQVCVCFGSLAWLPMFHALNIHDRLRPWCPWCRRRGKDDDEQTPAPQPVPVGVKER